MRPTKEMYGYERRHTNTPYIRISMLPLLHMASGTIFKTDTYVKKDVYIYNRTRQRDVYT